MLELNRHTAQDPPTWVKNLSHNLSEAHKLARENIGETQLRQKRDYDLRVPKNSMKLVTLFIYETRLPRLTSVPKCDRHGMVH